MIRIATGCTGMQVIRVGSGALPLADVVAAALQPGLCRVDIPGSAWQAVREGRQQFEAEAAIVRGSAAPIRGMLAM